MDIQTKDGILLRGIPEGTPDDVIKARIEKIRAETSKEQIYLPTNSAMESPKGNNPFDKIRPLMDEVGGLVTGMTGTARGTLNLARPGLGDEAFPKSGSDEASKVIGSFADPLALAIGGGIGKVLPYVPVLGKGLLGGVGAVGRNAASGAATGGAIGALSDEGTAGGGAVGGAIGNVVLPPAISGIGKVAGKVIDALSGRLAKVKAGNVLRDAAGADLPALRAAYAKAAPDETAAQASAGLKRDTLDALGTFASTADEVSHYSRRAAIEKQDMADAIRRIAGGANQTEARQVAEASQRTLNRLTTPMREDVLTQANIAGQTGTRLATEADALAQIASGKVADVRRLGKAGEIAETVGASGRMRLDSGEPPVAGLSRAPAKYFYGTKLAEFADRIATQPAADSLLLGQAARFKQMQVQSLADAGFKPMSGESIMAQLRGKIADPKIGSETLKDKVLTNVLDRFEKWTKADGIIDVHAAYGIRKSAVSDAIEQFMGAADPKSKAKAAVGVLKDVKPIIDDAIGRASGNPEGWKAYLKTFEEGMNVVNQKKMGAKFLELLEKSPNKFIELATGNNPKAVEKRFGSEYDIRAAMGDKMGAIDKVASALARNKSIEEGADVKRGGKVLREIIDRNTSKFKIWNVLDPTVAMVNRVLGESEVRIGEAMKRNLIEGMKSGKSGLELLNTLPTAERLKVIEALARRHAATAGGIVGASQGE